MVNPLILKSSESRSLRLLSVALPLLLGCFISGCSTITESSGQATGSSGAVIIPSNFDQALRENQKAFAEHRGQPDVALYNIGVSSAHSANPKKDYLKAIASFRTLVKEHPSSPRAEPAKIWLEALEQYHQVLEDGQKLADEKRALARDRDHLMKERDQLAQERNKLNYAIEKSRQLDAEIEMRRKQSLKR